MVGAYYINKAKKYSRIVSTLITVAAAPIITSIPKATVAKVSRVTLRYKP